LEKDMNLRAIYNKINCLCSALFASPTTVLHLTSGDEIVRLGDLTGDKPIRGLIIGGINGMADVRVVENDGGSPAWDMPVIKMGIVDEVKTYVAVNFPCPGGGLPADTTVYVEGAATSITVMYFA
jgi:hypothetical protein